MIMHFIFVEYYFYYYFKLVFLIFIWYASKRKKSWISWITAELGIWLGEKWAFPRQLTSEDKVQKDSWGKSHGGKEVLRHYWSASSALPHEGALSLACLVNKTRCRQGGHSRPRLTKMKLHLVICEQEEPRFVGNRNWGLVGFRERWSWTGWRRDKRWNVFHIDLSFLWWKMILSSFLGSLHFVLKQTNTKTNKITASKEESCLTNVLQTDFCCTWNLRLHFASVHSRRVRKALDWQPPASMAHSDRCDLDL